MEPSGTTERKPELENAVPLSVMVLPVLFVTVIVCDKGVTFAEEVKVRLEADSVKFPLLDEQPLAFTVTVTLIVAAAPPPDVGLTVMFAVLVPCCNAVVAWPLILTIAVTGSVLPAAFVIVTQG